MPDVDVLIPWAGGCRQRERLLDWTMNQYGARHPEWNVVLGESPPGPFNRAAAIIAAAAKSTADVFVVSDADVYCDPTDAVDAVLVTGWAVPHTLLHRLSAESTEKVLDGADWRGLPLSNDNSHDSRPYKGNEAGTLFVIRRDVLDDVPPDVRFVGWGSEDIAYAVALNTLVGKPWRGKADLPHLWHPPQERMNRVVGNKASAALERKYRNARRSAQLMRALVDEARRLVA